MTSRSAALLLLLLPVAGLPCQYEGAGLRWRAAAK